MKRKYPAYSKPLAERLRFSNPPFLVIVCVGLDAWERAKRWQQSPNDCWGLVITAEQKPFQLIWPVKGCTCVIDKDTGPSDCDCADIAGALFLAGAKSVTLLERDGDIDSVDFYRRPANVGRQCA